MRLRPGTTADQAITRLEEMLRRVHDASTRSFRSPNAALAMGPNGPSSRLDYLRAIDDLEGQVRNLFVEPELVDELHGDRYWRIHELTHNSPMPDLVIQAEIKRVKHLVNGWIDTLASYQHLAGRAGDVVAVLDTNAFMHDRLFTELPWHEVLGLQRSAVVRLVVLDELDDKGYSGNKRLVR